jgi:serine/threonine-protein kinase
MLARIRHPNIVTVHNAGNVGGLLYYVMDEIPGESLRQRLNRDGTLDPADTQALMGDIAAALAAASAAGFVHRDVKPENILLDAVSGRALLADFGIARPSGEPGQVTRTGQGVAVGTPTYMSPEQAAGEPVDTRSDVYSLGVVAYEALAGQPPFVGPRRVVVSKHIAERPIPIQRVRSDVPPTLATVIMRALEKHPADRWQGGEDLRKALSERRTQPRLSRPRLAIAAIGTLALIGALGLTRLRSEAPPAGINPRHSILVLPFQNLRADRPMDWMRDGAVSMLGLNLSQWSDLTVVDHERVHDLLAHHAVRPGDPIGLELARQLAREAGVWTVVLGEYSRTGDSLHLSARVFDVATGKRVEIGRIEGRPGTDVRPMFDELAARLLDLSGAPADIRTGLAQATTSSVEAFRAYLSGVEQLNRWNLPAAEHDFERANGPRYDVQPGLLQTRPGSGLDRRGGRLDSAPCDPASYIVRGPAASPRSGHGQRVPRILRPGLRHRPQPLQ